VEERKKPRADCSGLTGGKKNHRGQPKGRKKKGSTAKETGPSWSRSVTAKKPAANVEENHEKPNTGVGKNNPPEKKKAFSV